VKHFRVVAIALFVLSAVAIPAVASQFISMPFDRVVRGSAVVVRATVGPVSSSWDSEGEVIFSSAPLTVSEYLRGNGPNVLMVREVGGTVGDYTQQAIGFPELREGEDVVLFLAPWEEGDAMRIFAYRQGKYLFDRAADVVFSDPEGQGDQVNRSDKMAARDGGMTISEFREMVRAAGRGEHENERPVK
jgi:hypothetical protein